ncbi:MAG: hypothetical protein M3041_11935 [Acidobacteriota bacterium]|nr:hypothetical protein [Acidobacteriota bacterium]
MMKYARNVRFQIKNGKEVEFKTLFENQILPLLKKQNGFRDEVTLTGSDHRVAISLWDDRASAEKYASAVYPQVIETLKPVLDGTPTVSLYEIGATTLSA